MNYFFIKIPNSILVCNAAFHWCDQLPLSNQCLGQLRRKFQGKSYKKKRFEGVEWKADRAFVQLDGPWGILCQGKKKTFLKFKVSRSTSNHIFLFCFHFFLPFFSTPSLSLSLYVSLIPSSSQGRTIVHFDYRPSAQ